MKRTAAMVIACFTAATLNVPAVGQTSTVRVGWCARTITSAAAPYAIATKMGWFKQEGIEVNLVPLAGSSDCVKTVATRDIPFALPSLEPQAAGFLQGIQAKTFYTAYQGNIISLAVPADSPIKRIRDLKGKTIGVISLGSGGALFAKALVTSAGLNPETDVKIVVAGEGAQTAAMIRSKQVDALSQFDTQYALVENAGVKLRILESKDIERFPGNGFLALEETLKARRAEAVALARGYAKGTIFAINNPQAAIRIFYEVYPAARPTGKDEAAAIRDDVKVLQARVPNWNLEKGAVTRWGESSEANYSEYLDFLLKWGVINAKVRPQDVMTNELIDEINRFDSARVAADAKAYGAREASSGFQ
jgi:NitT/TauT family transport system substrate-binding protein